MIRLIRGSVERTALVKRRQMQWARRRMVYAGVVPLVMTRVEPNEMKARQRL